MSKASEFLRKTKEEYGIKEGQSAAERQAAQNAAYDYRGQFTYTKPGAGYGSGSVSSGISDAFNRLVNDTNRYYQQYNKDIQRGNGFDAEEYFADRKKQSDSLKSRAGILNDILDNSTDLYDQDAWQTMKDYLSTFNTQVDDVMGYYQGRENAKIGMQAYQDDLNATIEKKSTFRDLMDEAFRNPDLQNSPAYGLFNAFKLIPSDESYQTVSDQWTDEQKYNLGALYADNPADAREYAVDVNKGQDPIAAFRETEGMKSADLNALKLEIDQLNRQLQDAKIEADRAESQNRETYYSTGNNTNYVALDQKIRELEALVSQKTSYYNQAKHIQDNEAYKTLTSNADFAEKSAYVSTVKPLNELYEYRDAFNRSDPLYEYINNVGKEGYASGGNGPFANSLYEKMDEGEVAIFNYLYATEGKVSAQKYLDTIQETLNQRRGEELYSKIEGNTLKEIAFSISEGLTQPLYNWANNLNFSDYIPTSPNAYAGQMAREGLADNGFKIPVALGGASLGQVAYDALNTTANMLPSMAIGALTGMHTGNPVIGKLVGGTMMGAGAAGGAYQEALNSGYTKEQARTYSTLVGASEAGMEYLLGGISALGGQIPQKVIGKIVDGVDSALARAAIDLGGSMLSEGFEEGLQEVLTPWIKNLTLHADEDVNWSEVAYSSLLGALSAFPMEAPGAVTNTFRSSSGSKSAESVGGTFANQKIQVSDSGRALQISTNQNVDVHDFASVDEKGKATVNLKDGKTASMDDINFATEAEAMQFATVRSLPGIDTEYANEALHYLQENGGAEDTLSAIGVREAYGLGYYGFRKSDVFRKGRDSSKISAQLANQMFKIGQQQRKADQAVTAQALPQNKTVAPSDGYKKVSFVGKVTFDTNETVRKRQEANVQMMDFIADKFSGNTVRVYQSYERNGRRYYKDNEGKERRAPNGMYQDNEIWVDLNAGNNGEGMMLNTFGHEMYHHIEAWNKKGAQQLAEFLIKELGSGTVERAVNEQIRKARAAGFGEKHFRDKGFTDQEARNMVYDRAMSDFVADSLETMFTEGDPVAALAKLRSENQSLYDEIKNFVNEWVTKLREFVSGKAISEEGRAVAQLEKFEEIQKLFMEAMDTAGQNYVAAVENLTPGEAGEVFNQDGEPVAMSTDDGSVMLSIRTYEEDGRTVFRQYLDKCVSSDRLTQEQADEMRDGIEEIYNVCKEFKDKYAPFSAWSDAEVIRDTHGRPVFSVVTPNGDYKMNLDFSLVCKKRRTLDAVFNEMSKRGIIDDFELGQKSVVKINEIIRKYGLETACALCFVDAKRFRQASMADQFTSLYNELVLSMVHEDQKGSIDHFNFSGYDTIKKVDNGIHTWSTSKLDFTHLDEVMKKYGKGTVEHKTAKYLKTHPEGRKLLLRGDFMSSKGFDAVKTQNKDILKLYNSKKGTGGPKAAFGDVQYLNEIIRKNKSWTPAKAYEVGGVRIQSFSDYVPRMVFDYTQMIYDLAATKLPAHAYTKETLFVKQFGLTGVKINMSLIPAIAEGGIAPGLDANGNYVWAGESFDYDSAKEIQNADGYTENCGTICVGVSKEHILKLLGDPNIRMVIPYHKSGLNPIVAHMNKIAEFTDYTSLKTNPGGCQSTIDKNGSKVENDFNFNEELRKIGDPKATVRKYLDWCSKNEYTPKFAEFAWHENYYKLIEDFTLYDRDGNYVPQREVRAVFPTKDSAFGSMKDLIRDGLQEDAVVEGKRDKYLSSIVDEIEKSLPRTEAEIEETQVEQADVDLEAGMFSLREFNDGRRFVDVQADPHVFDGMTISQMNEHAKKILREKFMGKVVGIDNKMFVNGDGVNEYLHPSKDIDEPTRIAKLTAAGELDNLLDAGIPLPNEADGRDGHIHPDAIDFSYFKTIFKIGNEYFEGIVNIKNIKRGKLFKDVTKIKNITQDIVSSYGVNPKSNFLRDASMDIVREDSGSVKTEMNSLRSEKKDNSVRGILNRIDVSKRKLTAEKEHLGKYQDRSAKLTEAEAQMAELKAKIEATTNKKELAKLQNEQRKLKVTIDGLKNRMNGFEKTDLAKKLISDQKLLEYREEQKAEFDALTAEYRQTRKELTGADSVIAVMEDEFVKLAKDYEAKKIDLKTMEADFIKLGKKYDRKSEYADQVRKDRDTWRREFVRLMEEYDAAGKKVTELEAKWERSKERVKSRQLTQMRNKIERRFGNLDRLLRKGSKTSYVPEALRAPVSAILESLNMRKSNHYLDTLARYDKRIANEHDPVIRRNLMDERYAFELKGDTFAQKMKDLSTEYRKIKNDADPNISSIYDEALGEYLDIISEEIGSTRLGDMTKQQLETVYDVLTAVLETVRNANKAFVAGRNAQISEMSHDAMRQVRTAGGKKYQGKSLSDTAKGLLKFMWNDMRPVDIFDAIGSGQLTELFNNIRKGEDTWARDVQEAREFFRKQWQKYKGDSWDMEKQHTFTSSSGLQFQLNTEQIMSIYALFRRDKAQAMDHLRNGGFVFDNNVTDKKGKTHSDATAYNLTDDTILKIIGTLSRDQMSFVEQMQGYLSDVMGAKGNEVSMKLYGIKLFREKNYFPLRSAKEYMESAKSNQRGDVKIKNSGFTKPVKQNAKTAIVLTPFLSVWGSHVDEMSNYHAFVLPMEDMYRVYNYRTDIANEEAASQSVQAAIQNAYGEGAVQAIDQLLKDINGGVRADSTASVLNKMISRYKKGATMASLSVVAQQPSAILRAASMINPKYFVGRKMDSKFTGRTWEEIKKYAPIAIIKEMGGFDTMTGRATAQYLTKQEYKGFDEQFRAFFTDNGFRDDLLGRLPAWADEVSWGAIWNAVKREQRDLHPDMSITSDSFLNLVADRFTDVITHTQVYDSVLSKNAMMRSKDTGMKMITSFMAEPTVTANMLAKAINNAKRNKDYKGMIRTFSAVAASAIVNAAAVSVVYALRDDDEEERYYEKWVESFRENLLESANPMGYLPLLRDVSNLMKGYDIERADMSIVSDFTEAVKSLGNEDMSDWEKVEKFTGAVANIFGIPAKNIIRDTKGIWNSMRTGFGADNVKTSTGSYMAWTGKKLDNGDELLLAIQRGDTAHMERVASRFDSQEKAMSGLMSAIRKQYVAGDMTPDEAKELLMTYNELDEDEVYWKFEEWNYARENGSSDGYSKMGDLMAAVESGEGLEAEIQRYLDNGTDMSTIRSQISKVYRKKYLEADEAGREDIRRTVTNAYQATGSKSKDIESKFKDWDFEIKHGSTYDEMRSEYKEGNISAAQMRDAMASYGMKNYEIKEAMADLNNDIRFMDRYGMYLSDMWDAFDEGNVTRSSMISALKYSGKTDDESIEAVTEREIRNRLGIEYSKLDDAYKANDISRQTLYNAMIQHGAKAEEADEAIIGYDWLKKHSQYDLSISDAKKFALKIGDNAKNQTLEDYGVPIDAYMTYKERIKDCTGVDRNNDGQIDSGTKRDEIFAMIDRLPISDTAKDGLALISYSMKSIKKNAPWH